MPVSGTYDFRHQITTMNVGYPVTVSTFEDQTEQRRLVTDKQIGSFDVESPFLNVTQFRDFYAFYKSAKGALESFDFTSHLTGDTHKVRFDDKSEMRFTYREGLVKCSYKLVIVAGEEGT